MVKTFKIGHRGAKGHAPENTLIAFEKAIEMGDDGIELDVHLSSDGHLMVIHDETIDRTTNGNGIMNELSLLELKTFRIEKEQQIPTLTEVFNLVNKRCFINIELKGKGTAASVVALIQHYVSEKDWSYSHFLITSFDWNALEEVRLLASKIPLGVLTEENLQLAWDFSKRIKADNIHPHFDLLTEENTKQMQKEGFKVFAWTVNEREDIQKIKHFHVNGIISDFTDRI